MLRDTAGREGSTQFCYCCWYCSFSPVFCSAKYRGETEGTVVPEERGWKIVYFAYAGLLNPSVFNPLPLSHLRWAEGEDWKYHFEPFYPFGALWGILLLPCRIPQHGGVFCIKSEQRRKRNTSYLTDKNHIIKEYLKTPPLPCPLALRGVLTRKI